MARKVMTWAVSDVTDMLVSICLPTYNGREFICAAVESVVKQTYSEIELIICDDGSDDGTLELIAERFGSDSRIRCLKNETRLGLFANYNKCIDLANGQYIKPFAQDDELEPRAIEEMVAAFKRELGVKLVCVARKTDNVYSAHLADRAEVTLKPGRIAGKDVAIGCMRSYRNLIGEPVAVMCDQDLKKIKFDASYHSLGDLDCWLKLLELGDLCYIDRPLVKFRQHSASTTMALMKNMDWVLDFYRLSKDYEKYLKELNLSRDEYCMRFTELAGTLIDRMVKSGTLKMDDLDGYREVAYLSMRRCGQLSFKSREYDSVVSSSSWRLTEPLRAIMKMFERG